MVIFHLLPPMENKNLMRKDKTIKEGCQDKKAKVVNDAGAYMLLKIILFSHRSLAFIKVKEGEFRLLTLQSLKKSLNPGACLFLEVHPGISDVCLYDHRGNGKPVHQKAGKIILANRIRLTTSR